MGSITNVFTAASILLYQSLVFHISVKEGKHVQPSGLILSTCISYISSKQIHDHTSVMVFVWMSYALIMKCVVTSHHGYKDTRHQRPHAVDVTVIRLSRLCVMS